MATQPSSGDAYGASSMSSDPGGRNKTRSFDTSVGDLPTAVEDDMTVNECAAAQDAVLKASRKVEAGRIGLASSVESD